MAMGFTTPKKEPSTTGTGLRENMTALVLSHGPMEANTRVNGEIAEKTGKENL